jgi:hypothetical protein
MQQLLQLAGRHPVLDTPQVDGPMPHALARAIAVTPDGLGPPAAGVQNCTHHSMISRSRSSQAFRQPDVPLENSSTRRTALRGTLCELDHADNRGGRPYLQAVDGPALINNFPA